MQILDWHGSCPLTFYLQRFDHTLTIVHNLWICLRLPKSCQLQTSYKPAIMNIACYHYSWITIAYRIGTLLLTTLHNAHQCRKQTSSYFRFRRSVTHPEQSSFLWAALECVSSNIMTFSRSGHAYLNAVSRAWLQGCGSWYKLDVIMGQASIRT